MAKKKKKARRPNIPLYTGPVDKPTAPMAARDTGGGAPDFAGPARAASGPTQISADYTHIANDLKRIGLLAGGFIALLIALSFFVR